MAVEYVTIPSLGCQGLTRSTTDSDSGRKMEGKKEKLTVTQICGDCCVWFAAGGWRVILQCITLREVHSSRVTLTQGFCSRLFLIGQESVSLPLCVWRCCLSTAITVCDNFLAQIRASLWVVVSGRKCPPWVSFPEMTERGTRKAGHLHPRDVSTGGVQHPALLQEAVCMLKQCVAEC